MNELENLLRQQLHTAADPIQVPIDDQAVLAEGRRARTARTIRWSDGGGGVRFTGLDAAASGPVVLAGPTGNTASVRVGAPAANWTLAVLPEGATWATGLEPVLDTVMGSLGQVARVPGTSWVAAAFVADQPDRDGRFVWGTSTCRVFTSTGQSVEAATFPSLGDERVTVYAVDAWDVVGLRTASTGYEQIEEIRPGFLPAGSIAGQDGRSAAFAVLLPRGVSADSLTWDFGRPVTTTVPRSTKVLADGRTWVHEAFSAEGILDWQPGGPTVTYTAADGSRVTARVLKV